MNSWPNWSAMVDERAALQAGARELGVGLDDSAADALLRLLDELGRWNRAYNLTAIIDRAQMLTHHLLDSLSVAPLVQGSTVADVGTGAGFPGLPLAVLAPLPQLLQRVEPLCGPGTRVLAMKGRMPVDEIAAVAPPWVIEQVVPLTVPGLHEERHLIIAGCRLAV